MINLTQHTATADQLAAGVVDLSPADRARLIVLLTVATVPTLADIRARCQAIADLAVGHDTAMVGGAPWMAAPLEAALWVVDCVPFYAFSIRESAEAVVDGKTVKTSVFRHAGFVPGTVDEPWHTGFVEGSL